VKPVEIWARTDPEPPLLLNPPPRPGKSPSPPVPDWPAGGESGTTMIASSAGDTEAGPSSKSSKDGSHVEDAKVAAAAWQQEEAAKRRRREERMREKESPGGASGGLSGGSQGYSQGTLWETLDTEPRGGSGREVKKMKVTPPRDIAAHPLISPPTTFFSPQGGGLPPSGSPGGSHIKKRSTSPSNLKASLSKSSSPASRASKRSASPVPAKRVASPRRSDGSPTRTTPPRSCKSDKASAEAGGNL